MFFRLTLIFGFLFLTAVPLPPLCAQEGNRGINIFEKKNTNTPAVPRPKADPLVTQRLQEAMSNEFSPSLGDPQTYLMLFGFLLFLFLFVIAVYNIDARYKERFKLGYENPRLLFRELCSAHRLTLSERYFLKRFADEAELENPLPLFIEPQHFLSALQDDHFDSSKEMIRYFLTKLFDIHGENQEDFEGHSGETTVLKV